MAPNQEVAIEQIVAQARQANKSGNQAEAERLLRQAVAHSGGSVFALSALGELLYARRDFVDAARMFADAVNAAPDSLDLRMQLGNAMHLAGRPADAIGVFGEVARQKPDHWLAFNNLGSAWQALGQLDRAAESYALSLTANPKQFLANFNLGMLHLKNQNFPLAAQLLARAVSAEPGHVGAMHHLGVALLYQRQHAHAETIFRAALKLDPRHFVTLRSLGVLLLEMSRRPEAIEVLRKAQKINPGDAKTVSLIGNGLLGMNDAQGGIAELKRALEIDALLVDTRVLLANQLVVLGEPQEAARVAIAGLAMQPESSALRTVAADAMRDQEVIEFKPAVREIVLSLINDTDICTQNLAHAVISAVRNAPFFKPLLEAAQAGGDLLAVEAVQELMADDLLLAALPRIVVPDPQMETVLTALRRSLLLRALAKGYPLSAPEGGNGPFVAAMARHCLSAEYAQFVQPDEQQKLDALRAKLELSLVEGDVRPRNLEWSLGIYAMYAPLTSVPGWRILLDVPLDKWSRPLATVIREHVVDRYLEEALAGAIPELTPIRDETSRQFAKLYDANPYPRWRSLRIPAKESLELVAHRLRGGPVAAFPKPTKVLVAGCGTGQHPIQTAMQFPQAKVTALDISVVSLAYAARMAEQFNVHSIVWRRGDLLELGATAEKFSLVECVGVLHHVKNPAAALVVLRDRLLPGGLLKFGVYSRSAREHVEPARRFVKEQGFPECAEGIRAARRAILSLPESSPERAVTTSPDFYATSSCRYLAFPLEERTFTLPEIAEMLGKSGLRFLGFDLPARELARFREVNPLPEAMTDLAVWEKFEAERPRFFGGMYSIWTDVKSA